MSIRLYIKGSLYALLVCVVLFGASDAWAVPIKLSEQATQEANPNMEGSYDLDWSYVYNYKSSSAVAIDPYWIITAEHVADDPGTGILNIGGETYTPVETIAHSSADIALVRYDKALPGYYNYTTSTSFVGDEVVLIGYGYYGEVTQTPTSGSWDQQYAESPDVKRWGTNTIEALTGTPELFYTTISGTNPGQNPTDYETGVNTGDSGGGMFAYEGDEWVLIGINVGRDSEPYTTTGSVPIGNYDEWIAANVPEPVTVWSLAVLGVMAMLVRRRVR